MILVSNDQTRIINFDNVTDFYIGPDGCTIKVDFKGGGGCQLCKYSSPDYTKSTMKLFIESIGNTGCFKF